MKTKELYHETENNSMFDADYQYEEYLREQEAVQEYEERKRISEELGVPLDIY